MSGTTSHPSPLSHSFIFIFLFLFVSSIFLLLFLSALSRKEKAWREEKDNADALLTTARDGGGAARCHNCCGVSPPFAAFGLTSATDFWLYYLLRAHLWYALAPCAYAYSRITRAALFRIFHRISEFF